MDIDEIFDRIYPLPEHSKQLFKEEIEEMRLPKGYTLLHADRLEKNLYFIKRGIIRAYVPLEEYEITFWFGKEGDAVFSIKSLFENKRGYETIELLEDCELYEIKTDCLQRLFARDIDIANWGRRIVENELIRTEERLIFRQTTTASERYEALLKDTPDLLRRVPLKHIASYLGITQVSLSRIRGELK